MQKRTISIRNSAGIHCRPASVILTAINNDFPETKFTLTASGEEIEVNGILALISLGLCCGSNAELCAEGGDETKALQVIGDLFEKEFDFPPK